MSRSGPRRASIKYEDYIPKKGDLLDDFEQGITFECTRGDTWNDEKTGEKVKYGILVAYPDILEGAPLPRTFLTGFNEDYLGDMGNLIEGGDIQHIRRERVVRRSGEEPYTEVRAYDFEWDKKTRTGAYVYDPNSDE